MDDLKSYGEFRLINEIILPLINQSQENKNVVLGDDCSFIAIPGTDQTLVLTCDSGPTPLVSKIVSNDYRTFGWYAVAANISDLASAGAKPIAVLCSVDAPSNFSVNDFKEFFIGINEAGLHFDIINGGGDLRAGKEFMSHVTAIGMLDSQKHVGRRHCDPGDVVLSIGTCGEFIAAFLKARQYGITQITNKEKALLMRPETELNVMQYLVKESLIKSASDNSDGMLGAIWNIVEKSKSGVVIDLEHLNISDSVVDTANKMGYDPLNLFFMWGDYNMVVIVEEENVSKVMQGAKEYDRPVRMIGKVVPGPPKIVIEEDSIQRDINVVRNENFIAMSFNAEINSHLEYMLRTSIFS